MNFQELEILLHLFLKFLILCYRKIFDVSYFCLISCFQSNKERADIAGLISPKSPKKLTQFHNFKLNFFSVKVNENAKYRRIFLKFISQISFWAS
jgi:hypothetical protein